MTTTPPLEGTCAFRLMPHDELTEGPSSARLRRVGPTQLALSYTWTHPVDGPQQGLVLVGGPGDDGDAITAAWADSWHQQPGLMTLTGTRTGDGFDVAATYAAEFGWEISLHTKEPGETTMTMLHVVPESALASAPADGPPMSAGPYEVMVARWTGSDSPAG